MAELENIIESFMSSPESLGRIMDVVKMFGGEKRKRKKRVRKLRFPCRCPAVLIPI